jgi:replicative DNA helicase
MDEDYLETTPFHDEKLERLLLGSLTFKPELITGIDEGILYSEYHKIILREMTKMYKKTKKVDIVVLSSLIASKPLYKKYPLTYVASLLDGVPRQCASSLKRILDRLRALKRKRRLFLLFQQGKEILKSDNEEALPELFEKIKEEQGGEKADSLKIDEIITSFEEYMKQGGGIKLGIPSFDNLTNGLAAGEVLCFLASTGVGKSVFMQNALRYFTIHYPLEGAVLFSLEMSPPQLGERLLMIESGLNKDAINTIPEIDAREIKERHRNVHYITRGFMSLADIYTTLLSISFDTKIRLVIVDFLQRINYETDDEYKFLRRATSFLKDMAKELNLALILLSQVNRQEGGDGETPLRIRSGRGSGTIEQDADFVLGAYRPELNPNLDPDKYIKYKDMLIIQMLKSRRTPAIPKIECHFDKENLRLTEIT